MSNENEMDLISSHYAVQFINDGVNELESSSSNITLKLLGLLYSLSWPKPPQPPPAIDIGANIEEFIKDILAKRQLKSMGDTNKSHCETDRKDVMEPERNLNVNLNFNDIMKLIQDKQSPPPSS